MKTNQCTMQPMPNAGKLAFASEFTIGIAVAPDWLKKRHSMFALIGQSCTCIALLENAKAKQTFLLSRDEEFEVSVSFGIGQFRYIKFEAQGNKKEIESRLRDE